MLDYRCPSSQSPRPLSPGDASARHYWLMRRELHREPWPAWPDGLQQVNLSGENAANVHELLHSCAHGDDLQVDVFSRWWPAFERDPECAPELCLVIEDRQSIVAVAQCWTSAFIRYLAVHPRVRCQGIGQRLLQQAFAVFAQRNEGWLDLNVMENNLVARRLYEQAGMRYVRRSALAPD